MSIRVGVDIGGTFTDFCAFDERDGSVHSLKVLSTPLTPGQEVLTGLSELQRHYNVEPADISYFTHGTTVGVNTVIQRKGAKLALVTTANFVDVLELARLKMPDPYDLHSTRPVPLISRDRVFGLNERMSADGSVELEIDEVDARAVLDDIVKCGAEGIVVAFINSYRNPANEQRFANLIRRWAPHLPVYCSTSVWSIVREYERTATAVIHGYVQAQVADYLQRLRAALTAVGVPAEAMVTKSNGGVMRAELGETQCAQMILSGTAAGVVGAAYLARLADAPQTMSLDIGGTSADVAFIRDGQVEHGVGEMIGEFPIYIPSVSVTSIGAGGGSVAWVDDLGMLRVGPHSAGSTPGPVCYGQGGTQPTVTDAFAVLGYIGQRELGFGAITVDRTAARAALVTIASGLGRDVESTAQAIVDIAVSEMYLGMSKLISHYGIDPREFALMAFGGAGPMLGSFVARDLGVGTVMVPPTPGVLSALGGLVADIRNDFIATVFVELTDARMREVGEQFGQLLTQAVEWLREEQKFSGDYLLEYTADMRYRGQSFEIETQLDAGMLANASARAIASAFHAQHLALYGYADDQAEVQIINLRLVIVGRSVKPQWPKMAFVDSEPMPSKHIEVYIDGAYRALPLYVRDELQPGQQFVGPAVVVQADTTTCVPGATNVYVDGYANLILTTANEVREVAQQEILA